MKHLKKLWDRHSDLIKRDLTTDEKDAKLVTEWIAYYNEYNEKSSKGTKPATHCGCVKPGTIKFVVPDPAFIDGRWEDTNGQPVKSIKFGDTVVIKIKTANFSKNFGNKTKKKVKIKIMEYDPTWFDWDEQIAEIEAEVVNNEVVKEIQFKDEWYDEERDNQNEVYFEVSAEDGDKTIKAEFPKRKEDYLTVSQCPIRLYITRKYHWPKNDSASDENVKQGATISEYELHVNGKQMYTGYIMECAGDSTPDSNTDQRINPGEYYLIENPGTSNDDKYHRFRLVQREKAKVSQTFGHRSLINIHIGRRATDVKGCLMPMPGYEIVNLDDRTSYPQSTPNEAEEKKFVPKWPHYLGFAKIIDDYGHKIPTTTYDGARSGYEKSTLYYNVLIIIKEDFASSH